MQGSARVVEIDHRRRNRPLPNASEFLVPSDTGRPDFESDVPIGSRRDDFLRDRQNPGRSSMGSLPGGVIVLAGSKRVDVIVVFGRF